MILATDRGCNGCRGCCDGTLVFDSITPSGQRLIVKDDKSCFYMAQDIGCGNYEDRPQNCRDFECEWITDTGLPEYLKPSRCGFIIVNKLGDSSFNCYVLKQTSGYNIDMAALTWAIWWANETKKDLLVDTKSTGPLKFKNSL